MDKKASRAVLSSTKGLATDSKKSQDVWPRGGRRREAASSGSFQAEVSHKPIPQRNKTVDKRPRARGQYYPNAGAAGAAGGKENARLEDTDEPELGSVFVQGSKKQSLNHLLNFHYTPREHQQYNPSRVNVKAAGHRSIGTIKHKYHKEQFIQANCQFIVNSFGDYKQYMNNPDALVDWNHIEQVNVQVTEFPSCPICLYPPVAAKMTRCGHIYCWSCVLHYLALSDTTSRKCPICYESVHKQDLKSVVSIPHSSFNLNEQITFKLMKRARGSLIAYPFEQNVRENDASDICNMSAQGVAEIYSKLLIANSGDVMAIIAREKRELESQLSCESGVDGCFVEEAIALLTQREVLLLGQLDDVSHRRLNADAEVFVAGGGLESLQLVDVENGAQFDEARQRYESVSSENLGSEEFNGNAVGESELDEALPTNSFGVKYFYFYQASDGQHIYLHAVNVRMLEHTYGSLEYCPQRLVGRIVEKEGGSMTEELRNRLRYLQHLPVTCQFEVAEIHLRPPIISKDTMNYFAEQLETRKKRRQRRARDEKRREKRIAEEENRQMGKFPGANIELDNAFQFPDFHEPPLHHTPATDSNDTWRGRQTSRDRFTSEESTHSNQSLNSLGTSLPEDVDYAAPSFAEMLSTTKQTTPIWPGLINNGPIVTARVVSVNGSNPVGAVRARQSESEPENEDYVPAPQYNQSFSDAIALALEKASKTNDDCNIGEAKTGKKKKKNKQKVLFATSMVYGAK